MADRGYLRLGTPDHCTAQHHFVGSSVLWGCISAEVRYFCRPNGINVMKPDIHPTNYRLVIFKDMSNEDMFMGKSCTNTKDTVKWEDGNEYPLVKLDISQSSHPFYTGKMMLVDTAGRVDKFNKRFAKHTATKATEAK